MKKFLTTISTLSGNVVGFYDFTIYAFLATSIAKNLFPSGGDSLLIVYILHAGCYFSRPFGAMIYGWIGDKVGRNKSLYWSVGLTTFATFSIGCIPNFTSVGYMSVVLLVLFRLFQGLSVSGEEGGALVYLREFFGEKRKGTVGALVLSTVFVGCLLGSLVCFMVNDMFKASVQDWAWRIPFLLSLPLGGLSLFLRKGARETNDFIALKTVNGVLSNPLKHLFSAHGGTIIRMTILASLFSVLTSLFIVYLPNYQSEHMIRDPGASLKGVTLGLLVISLLLPLIGWIGDKWGDKWLVLLGGVSTLCLTYPSICLIHGDSDVSFILGVMLFCVMIVVVSAPLFGRIANAFPVKVRSSGSSFCINASIALFSGTTPFVSEVLVRHTGDSVSPAYWVMFLSVLSILCLVLPPKKESIKSGLSVNDNVTFIRS